MEDSDGDDWVDTEADRVLDRLGRVVAGTDVLAGVLFADEGFRGWRVSVEVRLEDGAVGARTWWFREKGAAVVSYQKMLLRLYWMREVRWRICLNSAGEAEWVGAVHCDEG